MCCTTCSQPAQPTDALAALVLILNAITRLEERMTSLSDNIDAIKSEVDGLSGATAQLGTAFADLAADVRAALEGVSPADQEKFDGLRATLRTTTEAAAAALASIASLDTEVGDRDGSDTPPAGDTPANPE